MKKIYLASPLDGIHREHIEKAKAVLQQKGFEVYVPLEHTIPNAWDYPNNEWGLMVFINDVSAIDDADFVVALSFGRAHITSGTSWECGYAFAKGKRIILVEINADNSDGFTMSLMVANGRYATVSGIDGLRDYNFATMPKTRTETEQK
jgi:nucleoside 2-deoxyribosyltransferase